MIRYINIFIFLILTVSLQAQDLSLKLKERYSSYAYFRGNIYENPADKALEYITSLSEFNAAYKYKQERQPIVSELGGGMSVFRIRANSYLHINDNSTIWGNAEYSTGVKKDVKWNSISDYDKIYPYILADSLGGNMDTETYSFGGGYSYKLRNMRLGVELTYRASQEYRNIDPRPRNIVSDLNAKIGASFSLNAKYNLGLALLGGKYIQFGDIDFYNELGVIPEYKMNGLGIYYHRFGGSQTSLMYRGKSIGTVISILPYNQSGISMNLGHEYWGFERIMKGFNNVPTNSLGTNKTYMNISYIDHIGLHQYGIKAELSYENKGGKDNIIGKAVSGTYPILGKLPMFIQNNLKSKISIMYNLNSDIIDFSIVPSLSYDKIYIAYVFPEREVNYTPITPELNIRLRRYKRKHNMGLNVVLGYSNIINKKIILPIQNKETFIDKYTIDKYKLISSNSLFFNLRYDLNLYIKDKRSFNISIYYGFLDYRKDINSHSLNISAGIVF